MSKEGQFGPLLPKLALNYSRCKGEYKHIVSHLCLLDLSLNFSILFFTEL